jgi:hypothetical protein
LHASRKTVIGSSLGHTTGVSCGVHWNLEHQARVTLELAKCLLEDLASDPDWDGVCACHSEVLLEFEALSSTLNTLCSCDASIDLERAAEVLRCAAALRVRCDGLAVGSHASS